MVQRGSDEGRRRAHQTRVARSRNALVQALVALIEEDVARGGTGVQIAPATVARRADVSTSTLYNRFPGGIPELASEAMSRARDSRVRPVAALAALAATHDESARVRAEGDARLRADLAQLPQDPAEADASELATLQASADQLLATASPDVAARVLLYLSGSFSFASHEQFQFARKASLTLEGVQGYEGEYKRALRQMVTVAETSSLSHVEWVALANAVKQLSELSPVTDTVHWTFKLDVPLVERAVTGGSLTDVDGYMAAFIQDVPSIPRAALSDRLVRGFAISASLAAQIGLLSDETIVAAAQAAYDLDQRLGCSSLRTLTSVYRLQLTCAAFTSDLTADEIFNPNEPHLPNAQGLMWAPFNVPLRRRLGMSSTPLAEKAFLAYCADVLFLTAHEVEQIAVELDLRDLDDRIRANANLDFGDDPAASLVDDLGRVVRELMFVHPQSGELRRRARNWSKLLDDELLEPVHDSLRIDLEDPTN